MYDDRNAEQIVVYMTEALRILRLSIGQGLAVTSVLATFPPDRQRFIAVASRLGYSLLLQIVSQQRESSLPFCDYLLRQLCLGHLRSQDLLGKAETVPDGYAAPHFELWPC